MRELNVFKYLSILVLCFAFLSCNENKESSYIPLDSSKEFEFNEITTTYNTNTKDLIRGAVPIMIEDVEKKIGWTVYQSTDNQLAFSLPDDWKIKARKKCVLYCNLVDFRDDYFALVTNSKISNNLSLDDYLLELFNVVSKDTTELLVDYEVKKITMEDRLMYVFSFETRKNNIDYTTFSCFTEDDLNIFDFTLKRKKENISNLDKLKFDVVLENFKINKTKLFSYSKDGFKIEKIEFGVNKN